MINYSKLCSNLFKDLPPRTREVIEKRFGFKTNKMTLEAIGQDFGICRERVRQIEKDGFFRLASQKDKCQKVFQVFTNHLKKAGGLKREDLLLEELGGENFKPQVSFLLSFGDQFEKVGLSEDFHSLWVLNQKSLSSAKKLINAFSKKFKSRREPLSLEELFRVYQKDLSSKLGSLNFEGFSSYMDASKKISRGPEGQFGLASWSEINPRGVKDKAYLVFKKENKPLHFAAVAPLISGLLPERKANVQTVHNELIKDSRFVLIGRGVYALTEWGYKPGCVKDVILDVLKESKGPLAKEKILEKVLAQRQVKKNTVLLNLNNKNCFLRDHQGRYKTREA